MVKVFKCDRCGEINETTIEELDTFSNLDKSMDL
jgi:hypothetical protein